MRQRRRPYKLLDALLSGTATQTLLTGVCCAIPLFVIPALLDNLSGNPFLPALLPAANIALVIFRDKLIAAPDRRELPVLARMAKWRNVLNSPFDS